MADERCVFPGDGQPPGGSAAARGPGPGRGSGRRLDRAAVESLLSGRTPDDAVGPAQRDEAERLARTVGALAALAADPAPADGELPGEAAALAAFRKARAERAPEPAVPAGLGGDGRLARPAAPDAFGGADPTRHGDRADDGGLVRIGGRGAPDRRRRLRHPVRLGLAAALAVGMAGGVAVAAGTGILPTPFDGTDPGPASSVSSPGPDRPLVPPSPGDGAGGATASDGTAGGTPAPDAEGTARGTGDDSAARGTGDGRSWPSGVTSACRDVHDGRRLDADRRRTLEDAAGGSSHVSSYCAQVLDTTGGQDSGTGDDRDERDSPAEGGTSGGQDRMDAGDEQDDDGDKGTTGEQDGEGVGTGQDTGEDGAGEDGDGEDGGGKSGKDTGATGVSTASGGSGAPGASGASGTSR
ncbi:hypothetical protein [Streptomyces sp. NPDC059894]|uniref:hypothetical protein n=1 Tax=unclassified Streptomyces TaxID=2593676 RepID=UPI0036581C71